MEKYLNRNELHTIHFLIRKLEFFNFRYFDPVFYTNSLAFFIVKITPALYLFTLLILKKIINYRVIPLSKKTCIVGITLKIKVRLYEFEYLRSIKKLKSGRL